MSYTSIRPEYNTHSSNAMPRDTNKPGAVHRDKKSPRHLATQENNNRKNSHPANTRLPQFPWPHDTGHTPQQTVPYPAIAITANAAEHRPARASHRACPTAHGTPRSQYSNCPQSCDKSGSSHRNAFAPGWHGNQNSENSMCVPHSSNNNNLLSPGAATEPPHLLLEHRPNHLSRHRDTAATPATAHWEKPSNKPDAAACQSRNPRDMSQRVHPPPQSAYNTHHPCETCANAHRHTHGTHCQNRPQSSNHSAQS